MSNENNIEMDRQYNQKLDGQYLRHLLEDANTTNQAGKDVLAALKTHLKAGDLSPDERLKVTFTSPPYPDLLLDLPTYCLSKNNRITFECLMKQGAPQGFSIHATVAYLVSGPAMDEDTQGFLIDYIKNNL